MRRTRVITFMVGWAVLTVLAALAVWWGLRPLLAPLTGRGADPARSSAAPQPTPGGPPSVTRSPTTPVTRGPSATASPTGSPTASPTPKPSMYDGWMYIDGSFTRSFVVPGGTATIQITGGVVKLVNSSTRPGYTMITEQPSPGRLVVKFLGTPTTTIDAHWLADNRPYAEVS